MTPIEFIAFSAEAEKPKFTHQVAPAATIDEAAELATWQMGYNYPLTVYPCTKKLAADTRRGAVYELAFVNGFVMTPVEAKNAEVAA